MLNLKTTDVMYEVKGADLRKAIEDSGVTFTDLAATCGYSGPSRISHLCKKDTFTISDTALGPIMKVLEANGVSIRVKVPRAIDQRLN